MQMSPGMPGMMAPQGFGGFAPPAVRPQNVPQGGMPWQGQPAAQQPRPTSQPVASAPPTKPQIRMQAPDEPEKGSGPPPLPPPPPPQPPAPTKIRLPSPEELGVAAAKGGGDEFDWGGVEKRLQTLRAVGFQMSQQSQGGWKVVCVLPTSQPDRTHRVETEGASRAEAVRAALEQAEKWAGVR